MFYLTMRRLIISTALALEALALEATLPLPVVPADLKQPAERACYIIDHFWDGMDFTDTVKARDMQELEQNFANFTSLFPVVADSVPRLQLAVDRLVRASEADSVAAANLRETAEIYLYDVVSPMHDDDFYRLYVNSFLASDKISEGSRMRYEYQLEELGSNRVGDTAADFGLVAKDGSVVPLSEKVKCAPLTVVMFFNPWCSNCHDISSAMAADPVISRAAGSGRVALVAVIADGEWSDFSSAMPLESPWQEYAAQDNSVEDDQLYSIRIIPTLYVVDSAMKVVQRTTTPEKISALLSRE